MNSQFEKGFLHEHGAFLVNLTLLVDIFTITFMHLFTLYANGVVQDKHSLFTLIFVLVIFMLTAQRFVFYRSHRTTRIRYEIGLLLLIWLFSVGLLAALLFSFEKIFTQDTNLLKAWFILTPVLLILSRLVIRGFAQKIRRMGRNFRNVGIVGATDMGMRIKTSIVSNSWMGMNFSGFFDARSKSRIDTDPIYLDEEVYSSDKLFELISTEEIHIVYIALPMSSQSRIKILIEQLSKTNVSIYYAPDFDSFDLLHSRWDSLDGQPVISIVETPFLGNSNSLKRIQDLFLATAAILVLAIPLVIVAILIKLDSGGPIIFKQLRFGLDGKSFEIYKFRTMHDRPNAQVFVQASKNDSRLTSIGRFLRKYSIDELPQLFNVLTGQMSIIGPRPHPIALDEEHQSMIRRYNLRFKVKPGITGWAQVNGFRGETDTVEKMEQRIKHDLEYIRHWSFMFDIKILFLTVVSVLRPVNAC